jgi:hypothetical protein
VLEQGDAAAVEGLSHGTVEHQAVDAELHGVTRRNVKVPGS